MDPDAGSPGGAPPQNLKNALGRLSSSDLIHVAELAAARDAAVRQLVLQMSTSLLSEGSRGAAHVQQHLSQAQSVGAPQMPLFALVNLNAPQYAVTPLAYMDGSASTNPLLASLAALQQQQQQQQQQQSPQPMQQYHHQQQVSSTSPSRFAPVPAQASHFRSTSIDRSVTSTPSPRGGATPRGRRQDYSEHFMLFTYKVKACARADVHDFHTCPYSHPSPFNKGPAQRRDPRRFHYVPVMCPYLHSGSCSLADCPFAHNTFECCAHPLNYRTIPCRMGNACNHPFCSFTHSPEEARVPCRKYCPSLKEFLAAEARRTDDDRGAVDPYDLKDKSNKAKMLLRDGGQVPRWRGPRSKTGSAGKDSASWGDLPYQRKSSPSRASSMGDPAPGTPEAEPGSCEHRVHHGAQSSSSGSGDESFPPSGNTSDVGAACDAHTSPSAAPAGGSSGGGGGSSRRPPQQPQQQRGGGSGSGGSSRRRAGRGDDADDEHEDAARPSQQQQRAGMSSTGNGHQQPSRRSASPAAAGQQQPSCSSPTATAGQAGQGGLGDGDCTSSTVVQQRSREETLQMGGLRGGAAQPRTDGDAGCNGAGGGPMSPPVTPCNGMLGERGQEEQHAPSEPSSSSGDESDGGNPMPRVALAVRGLDGKTFTVEARSEDPVSSVVKRVRRAGGYSMPVCLMAHGTVMQPASSLQSCGVDEYTTLQVLAVSGDTSAAL